MRAIYPGSFDPMTLGHANIIERAVNLFDELHVVIADNPDKKYTFGSDYRKIIAKHTIKDVIGESAPIYVADTNGLIVDYILKNNIDVIIRGIRNGTDLEYEMKLEQYNRVAGCVETVYLSPYAEHSGTSSSLVRMFLNTRKVDLIKDYVSPSAFEFIKKFLP